MNNYFKKLNINFEIPTIYLGKNEINYGLEINNQFHGIWYDEITNSEDIDFKKFVNNKDCKINLLQANSYIPPHTDSDIEAIINFYIRTDRCITQFYYPNDDPEAVAEGVDAQTDGAVFHEGYMKKSVRFMAHPGDAYLLDVSKPHSVIPTQPGLTDRRCICMQLLYKSFDEAVEMLQETGYLD